MNDDSHCKKQTYCDFEISRNLPDAQIEVCSFCGKKVVYYKDQQGNMDDAKYMRDHIRHTVQPYGRTARMFREIYGNKIYELARSRVEKKKTKAAMKQEWEEMRQDLRKKMKQTYV